MYPVSTAIRNIINGNDRNFEWKGTITLTNGKVHEFDASNIVQGSGTISSVCKVPGVGGAYAAELQMQMFININISLLKDAEINLFIRIHDINEIETWGDAEDYSWADLHSVTWAASPKIIYSDIPLGRFIASNVKRDINSIRIVAYDFMTKFDKPLEGMDAVARTPYSWLHTICGKCGVELGMTNAEIKALPNGSRSFTFADVNSDIKTYKDLISQLATVLCSIAVIDRSGKLIFIQYGSTAVATVTPDDRFSSEFEDYQNTYTGIYAQYKAGAIQEYLHNVRTLYDTGLILDIGCNVFLQMSNTSNRTAAVQAVIDGLRGKTLTPFDIIMPCDPTYDLLDVLNLTGNHAPANSKAPITSLSRAINGQMVIKCDAPEQITNPTRASTQVDGLSGSGSIDTGSVYASSAFWILIDSFPDATTVIGDDTITTELTINCTVDNTCTQITWTGAYTLPEDATVTVKVVVDNETIYELSDDQKAGTHILNVTTGHNITTQGEHPVKVLLSESVSGGATRTGIQMAANMARLTVLGCGWSDTAIESGDGFTIDGDLWKDIAIDLDFDVGDDVDWDLIAEDPDFPDIDWDRIIYTNPENPWIDPFTGDEYPQGGIPTWTNPETGIELDFGYDPVTGDPTLYDPATGLPFEGDAALDYTFPDSTSLDDIQGVYTDPLDTGTWTDPSTGLEFPGTGSGWIPESMLLDMADSLSDLAASDASLSRYSIPNDVIPSLFSGKVSSEIHPLYTSSDRPHLYSPPVWYLQKSNSDGWMFLGEPFVHTNADGSNITVYDESITIRDGSTKAVYWSGCTTHFWDNYVPSPYSSYPIQYVCWQCLYGSLSDALIGTNPNTITREDIENGTTGLPTMTYNNERYYRFKAEQVKDKI